MTGQGRERGAQRPSRRDGYGNVEIPGPLRTMKSGGYKVDVNRRERSVRVSSEWFNRPEDERSLSLDELWASVIVLWLASVFLLAPRKQPFRLRPHSGHSRNAARMSVVRPIRLMSTETAVDVRLSCRYSRGRGGFGGQERSHAHRNTSDPSSYARALEQGPHRRPEAPPAAHTCLVDPCPSGNGRQQARSCAV